MANPVLTADRFHIPPEHRWDAVRKQSTQIGQRLNNALAAIEDANLRLRGVFGSVDFANQDRFSDALLEKLKSNLEEVRARGGKLYVFADPESGFTASEGVEVITMPEHITPLQAPILYTLPLQLLAYHVALLRGTDFRKSYPVYNRMFWNYTKGMGEAAYNVNYHIQDANLDGLINESDAALLYPMGHGDAWGHFLSASKMHYGLLQRSGFSWQARSELYSLLGNVIPTDYLDEQSFARTAANRFWAQLHGTMMEGMSPEQAMEALGLAQAAAPAAVPVRPPSGCMPSSRCATR